MNTRDQIIQAGIDVFSANGYQKTSMEQIAAAAGLSKGALYYFFKSKADLFYEICATGLRFISTKLDTIVEESTQPKESIRDFVRLHVEICLEHPRLTTLVFGENLHSLDPQLRARNQSLLDEYLEHLFSILEVAERSGVIRSTDKKLTSALFLGMLNGICIHLDEAYLRAHHQRITDSLCDFFIDGLYRNDNEEAFSCTRDKTP